MLMAAVLIGGCTDSGEEEQALEAAYQTPISTEENPLEIAPLEPRPLAERDDDRSVAERLADANLSTRVQQALAARQTLRLYDFDVEVVGGVVILEGHVESESEKELAGRVAGEVDSVEEVVNRLTTSEPSRSESSSSDTAAAHHEVQPGESLWQIARSHNVRVERIKELNGVTSNSLQPGQRLRVR